MTGPALRRREPQPLGRGWELGVVVIGGLVIAIAAAALAGRGLASAVWGGGWLWPASVQESLQVLGGLLHGAPGSGLSPELARRTAAPGVTYVCMALAESALLTVVVATGALISRYRRPGDARSGMASRHEAERALGLRQLRDARAVIRPDRYGPEGTRRRAGG
ncbi:conserved exported protein of unknown function [Modestobacter italicus]|uniref:Conjugal transfer protein n=1 Tax=Modestobacter italicus (strain DSM 44449 / CECT 9708 / BC 501) TaxID=2732864 RepID=I4F0G9_MODI5|nr:hypothetical protein [Modestobacter marinus]CCH89132.1 conserved exported protein of unknown function [Modestobacter marinus]